MVPRSRQWHRAPLGHVQVIKPPVLLELSGPMFMSYPALNHVEIRLDQVAGGTKVTLRHRAMDS